MYTVKVVQIEAESFNLAADSEGAVYTTGTLQVYIAPITFQYQNVQHCLKCGLCFMRKQGYL